MKTLVLDEYRLRAVGVKEKNLYRIVLQRLSVDLEADDVIARYENFIYLTGLLREAEVDLTKYDLSILLIGLGIIVDGER